jgi:hypothetical protein
MAAKGRKLDIRRPDRRSEPDGDEPALRPGARFPLMHGEPAKYGDPPMESPSRADLPRSRRGGSSAPGSAPPRTHAPRSAEEG